MTVTETRATNRLAEYAAEVTFDSLPPQAISSAKACILDCLACMAGGSTTVPGASVIDLMVTMGGRPESTVVGSDTRLPAPFASYVNGFLANACDMDDNYFGMGHPGPAIIPTALALAQSRGASGADLIAAVVAGYEVGIRVGKSMLPPTFGQRQHVKGQSTWLMFGAIAAAGRLMGFDARRMATAFGLASTNASAPFLAKIGYRDRPMSTIKNNFGWTCMGAILAAELVGRGFVGTTSVLDGEDGFWRMAGASRCDWGSSLDTLGDVYEIRLIQFKPYPACYGTHPAIRALLQALAADPPVSKADLEKVVVRGPSKLLDYEDYAPSTLTDSQFSIPYVLSMVLLGKEPGPEWWDPRNLHSPAVLEQARKVVIQPVASMEEGFRNGFIQAEVTVHTRNGRTTSGFGQTPLPEGDTGLDERQLRRKLESLTHPLAGAEDTEGTRTEETRIAGRRPEGTRIAERILRALDGLELRQDIDGLLAPLERSPRGAAHRTG